MLRRHGPLAIVTIAILASLAITLTPEDAHADARSTFTVNPVDLVNGNFNFELESAVGPVASFHLGVDFLVWDGVWSDPKDDVFAVGPVVGLRLFPFLAAPSGLWLGPYAGLSYIEVKRDQRESTGVGTTLGGMVGYTLILGDVFVASAGIGVGYRDFTRSIDDEVVGRRGWTPRFRLSLGVAF